ncbi:MAG: DUF3604 domain-containing protein [Planctomycetes bacterium]|nr:DUF3604 domain-containing protein [Planctomycetota bacterium]
MHRDSGVTRTRIVLTIAAAVAVSGGAWWMWARRAPASLVNASFDSGLAGWTSAGATRNSVDGGRSVALLPTERGAPAPVGGHPGAGANGASAASVTQADVRFRGPGTYEFTVRARAAGAPTLELWIDRGVGGRKPDRLCAAVWSRVPGDWTELRTQWTTPRDVKCAVRLVARAGEAPVAGAVSVDEIAVRRVVVPDSADLTGDAGFDDAPSVARAPDGSYRVAWIRRDAGGESLRLAKFATDGATFRVESERALEQGPAAAVLGPRLVGGPQGVVAVYAAERGDDWRVVVREAGRTGTVDAVDAVELGAADATDVAPAAAYAPPSADDPNGALWVVWESNAGGERQTWIAAVHGTQGMPGRGADAAQRLGTDGAPSRSPSVAVTADGRVVAAWHAVIDGNTDVHVRVRDRAGVWGPDRRVTTAATIDRNAVLAVNGDDIWVVYENVLTSGPRTTRAAERRLVVAKLTDAGLVAPTSYFETSPVAKRAENAAPVFDAESNLRLGFARARRSDTGWQAWIATWSPGGWAETVPVSSMKGLDHAPSLVLDRSAAGGGADAIVAVQTDDLCTGWSDVDRTPEATSHVRLVRVPLPAPASTGTAAAALSPLVEPTDVNDPAVKSAVESVNVRRRFGDVATVEMNGASRSVFVGGAPLHLYFGNFHEHSDVSICDKLADDTVGESWQALRDLERLDFGCVTDHGENFNAHLWATTSKEARAHDDPGRFVTFLGEEWASSFEQTSERHPYGYYGHRNIVLADLRCPKWWNPRDGMTPEALWKDIRSLGGDFAVIPHQLADTGNVPTDWSFVDDAAQPVAEAFQVRGSYEALGAPRAAERGIDRTGWYLQDALSQGVVIGVIASPDHGGGYGKCCVWARDLTRASILDALRRRSTYGTSGARIALDVRVNRRFMGDEDPASAAAVTVEIRADCPSDIEHVEVCRDGVFHAVPFTPGRVVGATWTDPAPPPRRTWTYVRIRQKDGEIAWSSPVWFGPRDPVPNSRR